MNLDTHPLKKKYGWKEKQEEERKGERKGAKKKEGSRRERKQGGLEGRERAKRQRDRQKQKDLVFGTTASIKTFIAFGLGLGLWLSGRVLSMSKALVLIPSTKK